jgi:hypothetical protein
MQPCFCGRQSCPLLFRTMTQVNKLLLLLLLSFCCLALRCASGNKLESGNVNQQEIYQAYSINRSQESLEIKATIRLKDRYGDTLALTPPSHVTYNNNEMMRRDYFMNGANYVVDEKTFSTSNKFVFTDTKGKAYTNSISLEPLEFANISSVSLGNAAQAVLPVTRINKDEDVKVTLLIKDSKGTDFYSEVRNGRGVVGFRSSVYFDEAKKAIIIEADFLKEIAEGSATISLVTRKEKEAEQATTRGGDLSIEYAANPVNVKIGSK